MERIEYFEHDRREMLCFIDRDSSRILEVGCGTGAFASLISGKRELWGIEPDAEAFAKAKNIFEQCYCGDYFSVEDKLPDNYFDLIVCNDVIEHIEDPERLLLSLKKKLTKDGCIVGSVPNVMYISNLFNLLVFKDWQYTDAGILDKTHLRFFTFKSLRRLFEHSGFVVVSMCGVNKVKLFSVVKDFFKSFAFILFNLVTFFHLWDTRCYQIAFKIQKKSLLEEIC